MKLIAMAVAGALACCVSLQAAQEAPSSSARLAAEANNEFGFEFFNSVVKRTDEGNKFLSPLSAYLAFSMAYGGAAGETRNEMLEALQLKTLAQSREGVHASNLGLLNSLNSRGADEFTLEIANSLWSHEGFPVKADYVTDMERYYRAKIAELNFFAAGAATIINNWVSQATHDRIDSIVDNPLPRNLRMLLINATYFKADWTMKFPAKNTRMTRFNSLDEDGDSRQVQVPTMSQRASFTYHKDEAGEWIELPYGDSRKISMVVMLPSQERSIADVEDELSADWWSRKVNALRARGMSYGEIRLPKLEFSYEAGLNEAMQSLGMEQLFDPNRADLSGMSDANLYVSKALQKTFLAVDEEGTEAAAVTGILVEATSLPPQPQFRMIVDRPYLFSIQDRETGAVLFLGSIHQPVGGELPPQPEHMPSH